MTTLRLGILDSVSPDVARWLEGISPGARRALGRAGTLLRRAARANVTGRFLRVRSGKGRRGISVRVDQTAGIARVRVWPRVGYLAAHELGSVLPGGIIRPKNVRVLKWVQGGEAQFARFVQQPTRRLRVRPWLATALREHEAELAPLLEAEYQRLLHQAPGGPRG